jgi:rod shape determining protein RodA
MEISHRSIGYKLASLNWLLILWLFVLIGTSIVMLYSAAEGSFMPWALRQGLRFAVFFPVIIVMALIDIKWWFRLSYLIYAGALLLLILTEVMGTTVMGASRWLRIGPMNIQPSEVMKVCIVFALAHYFHRLSIANVKRVVYLFVPIAMVLAPVILVLRQPDLGTSLIILMLSATIFFAADVRKWKFVLLIVLGLAALPLVWSQMHDYQKARVTSFLSPEDDPLGSGYNILQSKIAIGSGGVTGKGFMEGTQSQLNFLPEKQTDFIFTMLTEEFGFIGGVGVLLVYTLIIMQGYLIALQSNNQFGRLAAMGMVSLIALHVFINVGMVMGMIPVVGAPLPILSYGGTFIMVMMIAFGMLLNISLYRDTEIST